MSRYLHLKKFAFTLGSIISTTLISMAQAPVDVKVFTLNMWENGTHVTSGLNKIANAIIATNADIVVLTELKSPQTTFLTNLKNRIVTNGGPSYNRLFVSAAGSPAQGDVGILSKYPIVSGSKVTGGISVFNVTISNRNVKIAAAHLDYNHYAVYLPRGYNGGNPNWNMIDVSPADGNPDPQTNVTTILNYNLASQKDEAINGFISWANTQTDPVILAGDFNDASHLDWTINTQNIFDHNGVIAEWQNTKALQTAGFTDTYRQVFPNEVTHPGITWPAVASGVGTTSWTPKADERDRIDYIFYKGSGISTVSSTLVGPNRCWVRNVNTAETGSDPYIGTALSWPSDHKGLMSVIRLFGSTPPLTPIANSTVSKANVPDMVNAVKPGFRTTTVDGGMVKFRLRGLKTNTDANLSITDNSGRLIKTVKINNLINDFWYTANLGSNAKGVYFLNLKLSSGESISEKVLFD